MGHRSPELLANAIEGSRFGIVLLQHDGRVLHANQPACDLLDRDEEELLDRALAEFVHADDRGWAEPQIQLLLAGAVDRIRQEIRLLRADGGEAWSELNARTVNAGSENEVRAVVLLEDANDRPLRERDLQRLADTDPLTELLNRRRFAAELDRQLAWTARYGARGALLVLDIDGLKAINDEHGHLAGDLAIQEIANVLRARTRSSDTVARLGGDEFAVLLPAASAEQAMELARGLLDALQIRENEISPVPLTVSIGITSVIDASDATTLFEQADTALYRAKRSGGNSYAIEPSQDVIPERAGERQLSLEPVPSDTEVSLRMLLETIADLQAASPGLVAWELYRHDKAVTSAWTAAVRDGLIERTHYDPADQDWQYRLTPAGNSRLRTLRHDEPDDQRPPGSQCSG